MLCSLGTENVGTFCDHLEYFVAIWLYIYPDRGMFCGHFGIFPILVFFSYFGIFFPIWYIVPRKIWQPCSRGIYWPIYC
jgi:hypothetical protein